MSALQSKISLHDIVAQAGRIVGRCVYVTRDGWVGVRDGNGRVDEYRLENVGRG